MGDEIPTQGISYDYPDSFDILLLRDDAFVSIRDKKITAIDRLENFYYDHVPLVNGRGFGIKLNDSEGVANMIEEFRNISEDDSKSMAAFSNRYFHFNQYRTLKFYFDYVI